MAPVGEIRQLRQKTVERQWQPPRTEEHAWVVQFMDSRAGESAPPEELPLRKAS